MLRSMDEVFALDAAYRNREAPVHRAATRLAGALRELDLPFAIAGNLACNAHGHAFTPHEPLEVLLRRDALERFQQTRAGEHWIAVGKRSLRDTTDDVPIRILLAGDQLGAGEPRPFTLPDPAEARCDEDLLPVLPLAKLVEVDLARAMTAADSRYGDLADVIALIRANDLPLDYADQLDPYVREKFVELWNAAQHRDPE